MEIIAEILNFNIDRLVHGWVAELRKYPCANGCSHLGTSKTAANIRPLLQALTRVLTCMEPTEGGEPLRELLREASHLGELRHAQGLNIGHLTEGYAVLRAQIWRLLTQELRDKSNDLLDSAEQLQRVLDRALKASVDTFHEIDREDLLELASIDSLTGLHNHAHFWQRLEEEVVRAVRYCHPVAVLMIDIDDFKLYNDRHGHPRGDQALREIAEILQRERRAPDAVARYGGEEFAVILPETDGVGARAVGERIGKAIAAHSFLALDTGDSLLTVSVGCAASEEGPASAKDLVEAADSAMYEAKLEGKNRIRVYVLREGQRIRLV